MFYAIELLIGVGVLFFIFWKYLFREKQCDHSRYGISDCIQTAQTKQDEEEKFNYTQSSVKPIQDAINTGSDLLSPLLSRSNNESKVEHVSDNLLSKPLPETIKSKEESHVTSDSLIKPQLNEFKSPDIDRVTEYVPVDTRIKTNPTELLIMKTYQKYITDPVKERESLLTESFPSEDENFRKTPKNNSTDDSCIVHRDSFKAKRESPPKERLTEFLEKTVLSDEKINSILRNLSLDKAVAAKPNSDDNIFDKQSHENDGANNNRETFIDPSYSKKNKQITTENILYTTTDHPVEEQTNKSKEEEQKHILKRLQKNPGFPAGLNFGSVIGELKNKTRNGNGGALKPVFKKFEADTVDTSINLEETLNAGVDEKKKVQIEKTELGTNILADTRTKLETASQQWRSRVPQTDANLFTVAGRLERDKVKNSTPPLTPPPTTPVLASPGIPSANKFRSRKQPTSPTNGFTSGPLRSASCAVVSAATNTVETKPILKHDRESFKRSHSVSDSISRLDEGDEKSSGLEKTGCSVSVPQADDETFLAFFAPALSHERPAGGGVEVDLDAIDSGARQLLADGRWRRARREKKKGASGNPLRALAARTDLRREYSPPPSTGVRERLTRDMVVGKAGLAAEALAALAAREDFSSVALRSAAARASADHSAQLLHVKGRRRVQTRLVEPIHTNINRGDCFILITADQLFLYIGIYSNVIERNRSSDIALHIQNTKDLGCKNSPQLIIIDEQTKNYNNKHWNQFWSLLGVTEGIENYKPVEAGHPDEDEIYESCIVQTNMCYEVVDDELIPIQEYWGQVPKIAMLQLNKVIVFDFGSEFYIWYGKNVPLDHRRRAAQLAQELFDNGYNYEECHINPLDAAAYQGAREDNKTPVKVSNTRPKWTILNKVTQHMETILFREKFLDWPDYTRVIKVKNQDNKANSVEIVPCDAEEMRSNDYEDPDLVLEGSHIGRGTHYYDKETMRHYDIKTKSLCKWIIQEFDYQKVGKETEIGEFFSGDSYILRWEYQITVSGRELNGKPSKHNVTGRDRCAYFCWQGRDASSNEKGAAALLTVELDHERGPQIRVAQGNEPPAFLNLFQGNLIIHQGKKDLDKSRYKLFVTRGNVSNEAYLVQVPCSVRQLRTRGSLLLADTVKNCLYIWHGTRSLKHTKNTAIELANKLVAKKSNYLFSSDVKITEVKEGEEPKEVLEALGSNKQLYNSILNTDKDSIGEVTPRLFHFTDLSGQFEANEVLSPLRHEHLVTPFPFEQKELYSASQPALFLLDSGNAIWLWVGWWPRSDDGELEPAERSAGVGAFANRWQALRAAALRSALAYAAAGSAPASDVRVVAAGLEPGAFTQLFDTWHERDDAAEANIAHGYKAGDVLSGSRELSRLTSCTALLPLAALQRRPLPDHVDPQRLELHLADADFLEAFGMNKEEFSVLPAWKQTNLKKDIGLF